MPAGFDAFAHGGGVVAGPHTEMLGDFDGAAWLAGEFHRRDVIFELSASAGDPRAFACLRASSLEQQRCFFGCLLARQA